MVLAGRSGRDFLRGLREHVGERGLATTVKMSTGLALDHYVNPVDRKYRIETREQIHESAIQWPVGRPVAGLHKYEPVQTWSFRRLLRDLSPSRDIAFVDLGCGKGRVLVLAAEYGFRRVIGVELAPEVYEAAKCNLERCAPYLPAATAVELVHDDATLWAAPDDAGMFFLFNPFGEELLARAIANIGDSVAAAPRDVTVVFHLLPAGTTTQFFDRPECAWLRWDRTLSPWGRTYYVLRAR